MTFQEWNDLTDSQRLSAFSQLIATNDAIGAANVRHRARVAQLEPANALLQDQVCALANRKDLLEAALRKLSNEVGALSIAKPEIIQAISLTNWNCLMTRLHQAQDVLSGSSVETKDE